jgi:3-hydroxyisobutyrate dehydrogenase
MRLTLLGTGIMGAAMARNLVRAGHEVTAWNRSRGRAEPLAGDGVRVADSAVEAVEAGIAFVDAPVMGSRQPAEAGELIVLASGPDGALDRVQPVFETIGSTTKRLGEAGNGTRFKLVANAWVVTLNSGIAEVLTLARDFDLRPEDVLETFAAGPLASPYAQAKGQVMLGQDFEAAFPLKHARKDAQLALAATDRELPVLEGVAAQLERAEALGYGDEDLAATICGLVDVPARAD